MRMAFTLSLAILTLFPVSRAMADEPAATPPAISIPETKNPIQKTEPSEAPEGNPVSANENLPITNVRTFPNVRELSKDDYAFLGEVLWRHLQANADNTKKEFSSDEVRQLFEETRRNGNRIEVTIDDLEGLLRSRQMGCSGTYDSAPGVDLADLGIKLFK